MLGLYSAEWRKFGLRFFFSWATLQMGGAHCLPFDQSPATVVQGITRSQLPGYRYQASTLDPHASSANSRCPGKLTPVLPRAPLAASDFSRLDSPVGWILFFSCRLMACLLHHTASNLDQEAASKADVVASAL